MNQGLKMKLKKSLIISSLIAVSIPTYVYACASCGCSLSTDWDAQGISGAPGIRLDLRYDYLNQDQYRSGSGKTSKEAVNDQGAEVENKTKNNYVTAGIDYSPSRDWGINVQIPYIDRSHSTYGSNGGYPSTDGTDGYDTSHTKSIGDIKVIGRYLISGYNLGLQLGVKLPTGDYKKTFDSGDSLDRGLQPGSGTTDLLVGAYHFGSINKEWDYFAQTMAQIPTNFREGYKPGNSLSFNFGVRYMTYDLITPSFQVNIKHSGRDEGSTDAGADPGNTGGTLVYLSPGATVNIDKNFKVYGYVQVPIYQYVNGNQLAPTWIGTLGARYNF